MITSKQIIEKFCSGPATITFSPEALQECAECEDLESLIQVIVLHMDLKYDAQACAIIMKYLDWELD